MEKNSQGVKILELILRYIVGSIMIAYGLAKIIGDQFALPLYVKDYRLKDLDGVTMTWAFMEFSDSFSIFLGIYEFLIGVMLLFSKTRLLALTLLLPTTISIFLINVSFDFLPHMKVLTGGLLFLNILLLYPYKHIILRVFQDLLQNYPKRRITELIINIVLIGSITYLVILS